MRPSTRPRPNGTAKVLMRWRGMGAILAVCFYSLFFSAHLRFQESPIYVRDGVIFGVASKTVFYDLSSGRTDDHRGIGVQHPAFTLIHQPAAQLCIKLWESLGQDLGGARKHGVAMLTCLAGAFSVVMIYHALLWSGSSTLRSILLSMCFGAGTCTWIISPLPQTWTFAGLGIACLIAVHARGSLARPIWHLLASVYAMCTFTGSIIPCLIMVLTRCAQERTQLGHINTKPLIVTLAAFTISFGLANLQRTIYPTSTPLPKSLSEWKNQHTQWQATPKTQALVSRQFFVSNIVAPAEVTSERDNTRAKVILSEPEWSALDLRRGLSGGWLLLLALAFAGLVWRAQIEPFTLGIISILMWNLAALQWYGAAETLLPQACLWSGVIVVAVGLGLERTLVHWQRLTLPVTLFLAVFVSALITRNWMFLQKVANVAGQ